MVNIDFELFEEFRTVPWVEFCLAEPTRAQASCSFLTKRRALPG
jgi:hypothetical protein